jgi:tRNA (adenine57-N1/adenine58-N1)-methyltransferase
LGWNTQGTHAQDGDLVQLVGLRHKNFIIRLHTGAEFQSHRGVIQHDALIGQPWGSQVFSHNGSPFFILPPSLADLLANTKRNTQIVYPKDVGFIMVMMGIGPGMYVLEAGTGSGAMTSAFAYLVGPQGHVTSYEVRQEMQDMARKNLELLGMDDRVTLKLGDIGSGIDEIGVDALFLDLPNPWDYMLQVRSALKPGGTFACILPTANQVQHFLSALREHNFAFIEVCETFLRWYKAVADRFRPTDRMVGHTAYLVFARPVIIDEEHASKELLAEAGLVVNDEDLDDEIPLEI